MNNRGRFLGFIVCAALVILLIFIAIAFTNGAKSDEVTMYVICQPGDYVCVRSRPSRKSFYEGSLTTGYSIVVNTKKRNGYYYAPYLSIEAGEGWIYKGYLVEDEPISKGGEIYTVCARGRVKARKCIDGKRRCWLHDGDTVKVWYWTEEWCVTNRGFVMTRYLEEGGEP